MKKILLTIAAAVLMIALGLPVQAAFDQPYTMYVTKDNVTIYKSADKKSDKLKTVNASDEITAIDISENGKWYQVTYLNKKGKEKKGWIQEKYLSPVLDPSFCKHDWGKWKTTKEATCEKKGTRVRTCKRCGLEEEEKTKKLDHDWTKWKVTKEATCTAEGERERECKNCGTVETEKVKKTDHDWDKWEVTKEATCTTEGERERECKKCDAVETEKTKKADHQFGEWSVTKEATCTAEGEKERECKNCDYTEIQAIAKLPHEFEKWEVTKEATCTEKGEQVRECKNCDFEEKQVIDMVPHDFSEWGVTVEATDHSAGTRGRTCKVCGFAETEDFDPEGTVRRGARGENVAEIQQLLVDQKYLAEGAADGAFGGGTESALMKFQTDQGFTADGVAWPQTIEALRHEFTDWTVTVVPTRSTEGARVRTCTKCGYTEEELFRIGQAFTRGTRGEEIRILQSILNDLNYDAGTADGAYGPKLDRAFSAFAKDHGLTFTEGQVQPADIDALVMASFAEMPEGSLQAAEEELVLSLTPVENAIGLPEGWKMFDWTLANSGTEDCQIRLLLLSFGEEPDFRSNALTIAIGGDVLPAVGTEEGGSTIIKLEADENESEEEMVVEGEKVSTASGTFVVDPEWGEGSMNFCAIATSQDDGAMWISNVVTQTTGEAAEEAAESDAAEGEAGEDEDVFTTTTEDGEEEPEQIPAGPAGPVPQESTEAQ